MVIPAGKSKGYPVDRDWWNYFGSMAIGLLTVQIQAVMGHGYWFHSCDTDRYTCLSPDDRQRMHWSGQTETFSEIQKTLGHKTYCSFEDLAKNSRQKHKNQSKRYSLYDREKAGFWKNRCKETCLITSNETTDSMKKRQKALEQRSAKCRRECGEEKQSRISPQVQEVLDKVKDIY